MSQDEIIVTILKNHHNKYYFNTKSTNVIIKIVLKN